MACASGIDAAAVLKAFESGGAAPAPAAEERIQAPAPATKAAEKKPVKATPKEEPEEEAEARGGGSPTKGMAMPKLALKELKDKVDTILTLCKHSGEYTCMILTPFWF
jgi:hypothetical protein